MVFRSPTNKWNICIVITYAIILELTRNHINGDGTDSIPCSENKVECQSNKCCSTVACQVASQQMCQMMDFSADPCRNFYKFTCGGLHTNNSMVLDISQQNEIIELNLLNELLTSSEDLSIINDMKKFYAGCKDENSLTENGVVNMNDFISALGGWHLLNENGFTFSWENYITKWLENGIDPDDIFAFNPFQKSYKKGTVNIEMKLPTLSLPAKILARGLHDLTVQSYFNTMKTVTEYLIQPQEISKEMEAALVDILNFEISLAKLIVKLKLNDEINREVSSIEYLNEKWPEIPWYLIFDSVCMVKDVSKSFRIEHFHGIQEIAKFLQDAMKSPVIVGNYVIWKAIAKVGLFFNPVIYDIFHKTFQDKISLFMNGQVDHHCIHALGPWICNCIEVTRRTYSTALNYLYQKKVITGSHLKTIKDIVDGFKDYFKKKILTFNAELYDKEVLKQSLNEIKYCIGFHEDISSHTAVEEYYKDAPKMETTEDPINVLKWYQQMNAYNLKMTNKCVATTGIDEWLRCKTLINMGQNKVPIPSEVMVKEKTIFISPRLMSSMGVNSDLPDNIIFGRVGFYIARLLSSFILEVVDGEHVQVRNQSSREMMKNDACVRKEIAMLASQIDDKKLCYTFLNSTATVDTILDDIALTAVHDLFKTTQMNQLSLPRYEKYLPRNFLWITYGTWMCNRKKHKVNRIRVLMAARKHEEFSYEFQCLPNTNMNPEDKCPGILAALT